MKGKLPALILSSTLVAACGQDVSCPLTAHVGLRLEVIDSVTQLPPSSPASLLISGTSADTLPRVGDTSFNGHSFTALIGAPGTYTLTVSVDGYKTWIANNVVVEGNACGDVAKAVELTARLQRQN